MEASLTTPNPLDGLFQLARLSDPATIPPRTEAENVKYGVPGYGIPGTTCRTSADIPFVGALVKMDVGDSCMVPPRRLTAARGWVHTATEFLDRSYMIAATDDGHRCWRTR
jgi:hypothetical protein